MHFWTLVFDNGCHRQILDVFILMINKSENNANITRITTGRNGLFWVLLEPLSIVYLRTQSSDLGRHRRISDAAVQFRTASSDFELYLPLTNFLVRFWTLSSDFTQNEPKEAMCFFSSKLLLFPSKPDRVSLTRTKKWKRVLTFLHKELKTLSSELDTIWHGLMLLWLKHLMNVTERLQFIGNLVLITESKT